MANDKVKSPSPRIATKGTTEVPPGNSAGSFPPVLFDGPVEFGAAAAIGDGSIESGILKVGGAPADKIVVGSVPQKSAHINRRGKPAGGGGDAPLRISDAAFARERAALLAEAPGRWVAYQRERRLGIFESKDDAVHFGLEQGCPPEELYVMQIIPQRQYVIEF